ncbi:hypothetical protein [Streptomyces sp. NPDC058773]|uniref:hypothetical protein n=1 Tax=Streptomyces sp. NPDC058773 TaxID=3346632 RepID=UPI0036827226
MPTRSSCATPSKPLREALDALQHGIDTQATSIHLPHRPTHAVVRVVHQGAEPGAIDTQTVVLKAVAQHLAEWRSRSPRLDPNRFTNRRGWRRAMLAQTRRPTVLSRQGGPLFV